LSSAELDAVSGGFIDIVADSDYFGIEISIGGWGAAFWITGGSLCGSVSTPGGRSSGCIP
jgi:hypothetical protein